MVSPISIDQPICVLVFAFTNDFTGTTHVGLTCTSHHVFARIHASSTRMPIERRAGPAKSYARYHFNKKVNLRVNLRVIPMRAREKAENITRLDLLRDA